MGLLQSDERIKSIIKSKQLDFKVVRYEYDLRPKRFYEEKQRRINEIIDSMQEKLESLHVMGFESIKYLEEQALCNDKNWNQEELDELRFMSYEEWEKSLSEKDQTKIHKRTQDQRKVLKRILETDLGLIDDQELYDEIKYRK